MFKPVEREELNQISLTGMRSIVLIGLLMVEPRTLEEIRDAFIRLNILDRSNSNDILRIDINTIKAMGCEITRASAKTDYKYVLLKHPFTLKLTEEEVAILNKAYKLVKPKCDLEALFEYDKLFKKIMTFIDNEDTREAFAGISILKYFDINFILELMACCEREATVTLLYDNPTTKKDSVKEIVAERLVYQNDKIYLYGYDLLNKRSTVLNLKRIKNLIGKRFLKSSLSIKSVKTKFFLREDALKELQKNEQIVETLDGGCIVEGYYHNEFLAIQRMLSFGFYCTVLEPSELKQEVIKKLKEMRDVYDR